VVSLLRCVGCRIVTGDAVPSRRDREPRCGPCERRADHDRRVAQGDPWYGGLIIDFALGRYGDEWEREPGWRFCADLFGDVRALCGWQGVGVELPERVRRLEIETRPCPDCGETVTSVTNYMCATCHFRGWWPPNPAGDPPGELQPGPRSRRVIPGAVGREIAEQWVDYPEQGVYRPATRKLWYVVVDAGGVEVTRSLRRDIAELYLR
jgi:hypothetical protein